MKSWLGWIAVLLLSLYLAVYPALATGLAWKFGRKNRLALLLVLAGAWTITEWMRGSFFTGFPWNPAAAALVPTPMAIGSVPTIADTVVIMTTPLASMRYGTLARLTGATETVAAARGWAAGAFAQAKTASETNGAAKNAARRYWRNPIICDGSTVIQGSAGWGAPNRYSAPNKPRKPIQLIVQYVQVRQSVRMPAPNHASAHVKPIPAAARMRRIHVFTAPPPGLCFIV